MDADLDLDEFTIVEKPSAGGVGVGSDEGGRTAQVGDSEDATHENEDNCVGRSGAAEGTAHDSGDDTMDDMPDLAGISKYFISLPLMVC